MALLRQLVAEQAEEVRIASAQARLERDGLHWSAQAVLLFTIDREQDQPVVAVDVRYDSMRNVIHFRCRACDGAAVHPPAPEQVEASVTAFAGAH